MKKCLNKGCIIHMLALIANIIAIVVLVLIFSNTYGEEKNIALLFLIPPVLSVIAMRRGGDKEERQLKKRIRKAGLRKELKKLSEFDKTE